MWFGRGTGKMVGRGAALIRDRTLNEKGSVAKF